MASTASCRANDPGTWKCKSTDPAPISLSSNKWLLVSERGREESVYGKVVMTNLFQAQFLA